MAEYAEVHKIWKEAEAFDVNGEIFPAGVISGADSKKEVALHLEKINADGMLYEVDITMKMIEEGRFTNEIYTLEMNDEWGKLFLTPLFYAGKSVRKVSDD